MYFFDSPAPPRPGRPKRSSLGISKGSSSSYWYKEQLREEKANLRYAREKMTIALENRVEIERLRSIDRAYSKENLPSELTQAVLKELQGGPSGYYSQGLYGRELKLFERHDVGRAMVLQDLPPKLFDSISLDLTEKALLSFSLDDRKDAPFLSLSTRGGVFNWKQFLRDPLSNYLQPGRERWTITDSGPLHREDMKLELKVKGSPPVKLKLSVLSGERGLRWSLRGGSQYRPEHRKLLGKLNGILDDYNLRLQWAEQYRRGWAVPRLSDSELKELSGKLSIFYDLEKGVLDPLKQRMILSGVPDEPIKVKRSGSSGTARIYPVRCRECGRVAAIEITELVYPDRPDRGSNIYIPSVPIAESNKVLRRIHEASPCLRERSEGTSSRTSKIVAI